MSGMALIFPIQNVLLKHCTFSLKICPPAAICSPLADKRFPQFTAAQLSTRAPPAQEPVVEVPLRTPSCLGFVLGFGLLYQRLRLPALNALA